MTRTLAALLLLSAGCAAQICPKPEGCTLVHGKCVGCEAQTKPQIQPNAGIVCGGMSDGKGGCLPEEYWLMPQYPPNPDGYTLWLQETPKSGLLEFVHYCPVNTDVRDFSHFTRCDAKNNLLFSCEMHLGPDTDHRHREDNCIIGNTYSLDDVISQLIDESAEDSVRSEMIYNDIIKDRLAEISKLKSQLRKARLSHDATK